MNLKNDWRKEKQRILEKEISKKINKQKRRNKQKSTQVKFCYSVV